MKQITEYLLGKNKPKVKDLLDKCYTDVYELVDDLNIWFSERLKKPIKVIKTDIVYRPISFFNNDGIHVINHFTVEFNDTTSKLRFGIFNKDLMMQEIFKSFKGNTKYGTLTRFNGYKFGTNFLDWLNELNKESEWSTAVKLFKL